MKIIPILNLYSSRDQEVQSRAGLNWGLSNGHVNTADAYIALSRNFLMQNPNFFPSQGSTISVTWDDGVVMECLLEGTQEINGTIYPKQISTFKDKSVLGIYLRGRLEVSDTHRITRLDLQNYGRDNIEVISLGLNKYSFNFG
ncbi:hypothetical protein ACIQYS_22160 [Psychrobacillus sp. NPDC096426]|uniref:hypothetical protein n=1 Tax=Psychrobacillus sp. NPDC096426 TaxID=3364491 RepID=UPI0038141A47